MPLLGSGVLANWGGVLAEAEEDYNAWHSLEHLPERLAVPGFLRGRRCVAVAGTDPRLKYFMGYEVESPEVLVSAPYLARLNDPTAWTRRILSAYVAPCRTVCRVLASQGRGVGGFLGTVQIVPSGTRDAARALAAGAWMAAAMARPGIIGAHAVEGDDTLGQQPTAEKRFRESRGEPDRTVAFALLIDGLDEGTTAAALADAAHAAAAVGTVTATLYRTQHVLARGDLA
ncbi:MAG: hypothetical protein MUC89_11465 [Acetobacteraceae bacterium]|jgi:hypothetical protein|nr:hypothetical protein [Acetobacteraceae bacterium]